MANEINVFEMTNTALKSLYTESAKPTKSVKESVKRKKATKKEAVKRIPKFASSKIRIESLSFMKEADEEEFTFEPEDEVVVVIDPEMEEVPATEEEAQEAAEELVGCDICKCSICGANYACDCEETIEEDVDGEVQTVVVDGVCPVCGEEGTQIVVGEIVPVDGEVDEEEFVDDEEIVDDDDEVEVTDDEFEFDDEGEIEEESYDKSKKREACNKKEGCDEEDDKKAQRKEAVRRTVKSASMKAKRENARQTMRRPAKRVTEKKAMRRPMNRRVAEKTSRPVREFKLDEVKLSRLFTKFAKENYSNVASVRFTKGNLRNGKLTLEGVVRTAKGSKRTIKLVAENYKKTDKRIRFVEYGPFTESVKTNGKSFVVECAYKAGVVTPMSLRYNFKAVDMTETPKRPVRESKGMRRTMTKRTSTMKEMFEVKGIVK